MLILTRKLGESIRIGDEIKITISDVKGKQIRLGIEAPEGVSVHREEIYQTIRKQNIMAAGYDYVGDEKLSHLWDQLIEGEESK